MVEPNLELTNRILAQGKALECAIEALEIIEPSGWFERAIAGLLLSAYKRRLCGIVEAAPEWMAEEIFGTLRDARGGLGNAPYSAGFGKPAGAFRDLLILILSGRGKEKRGSLRRRWESLRARRIVRIP